ncbi:MAG: acyloxyacyl hydrolase [Alphaproteobacteria bacterium]|nr:acyloxyacyl hydrolase [Alphaproteobacteria bacterium]
MAQNPFMGTFDNQITIGIGQGVNSGFLIPPPSQFVPFNIINTQYSQKTTFFKLPARQSINISQTIGGGKKYGWQWDKYTIPIAYLSKDAALLWGCDWYYAIGAGVGFQAQQNKREGSKLLFQFKITLGYKFTNRSGIELFIQHFSNGNTDHKNYSYAFYGASITYNF